VARDEPCSYGERPAGEALVPDARVDPRPPTADRPTLAEGCAGARDDQIYSYVVGFAIEQQAVSLRPGELDPRYAKRSSVR
jgi:hypothetical protein